MTEAPPSRIRCELETERFILKPLDGLAAFRLSYPWTADAEIMRNVSFSPVRPKRMLYLRQMVRGNKRRVRHAIIPRGQTTPIGMHTTEFPYAPSGSLSVVISDRHWWGADVVVEIRRRLIEYFFASEVADRFASMVLARNFPAVFNYQKLGFKHVGTLHRARRDPVSGERFDILIFELLRQDWPPGGAAP